MEWTALRQRLHSEIVLYVPRTSRAVSALPTPPNVDFVSQDNNNLITTHYFKRVNNSLIFVPTAGAVLWTALHTPQHCSGGRSTTFIHS